MAKPTEEKSDGLEIISIGTLYSGPWDKKYWSSSRGKDRYPYPVGYQAVRTHNGITYKMEIHEGLKGPLFVINSTEGQSCSGQTPEIAWESFQKKGCPRIKLSHGKRFSCKIDGVEFFGFKNPFVQRLLRELVANVDGTAEQSLSQSGFCNRASGMKRNSECTASCTCPDLLPQLERTQIKGKRSRKHKIINLNSISAASLKRRRPQEMHNAEASTSRQGTQRNHNDGNSMTYSASNEKYDIFNNPGALPASVNLETVVGGENNPFSAEDGLPLESSHFSDHLKKEVLPQEESKLVSSENCIATGIASSVSIDDEPFDRSKDTEIQGFSLLMATENNGGEAPVPKDSQNINDMDLCAPDTLDLLHDNTSDSAPNSHKESPYNVKGVLIAGNVVISEGLVTELHPEEEKGTSNASSEKSDFDSVGEDIAKSMMTVLLPRALPLLKTFSRKKKATINTSGISLCMMRTQEENNGTDHCVDVASPAGVLTESSLLERQENENMHILSTDLDSVFRSSGQITPIVPDSFENDQCGYNATYQLPLFSDVPEAGVATLGQDTCTPGTLGLPVSVDAPAKLSISHVETSDSKKVCSYDEVHMASIERPQKGILISESTLGSPSKNVFIESNKDMCKNSDENLTCLEIHSKEKDLKTPFGCAEAIGTIDDNLTGLSSSVQKSHKEINVGKGGAGTGNTSCRQIPIVTSARKYNGPLTESIICRNFRDGCAPETYTTTKFLLASEIQPLSSLDHSPNKEVPSGDEARLDGCPQSSHTEKNTLNPDAVLHNMAPVISQNQGFVCASDDKDNLDFFDPSVSCEEKSQACVDKELLRHQNLVEFNNSVSWLQKQGTSFGDDSMDVKDGSNLKPRMNMEHDNELESTVELVGCYVHPMPVSSVLLSTKGNEVYICVLCGVLVDEDRTLLMYKVRVKEQSVGCPSFIGHTPIMLPISRDAFGREIALDRSGLQFTPDGQCLILLNNIKAPYCREGKMHCPCSTCTSDCFDKNAVKIVQVKLGHVSVMANLKTVDNVHCVLVCDPNYLVGVEENGRLHLWVMNSTWSAQTEECDLPTSDCISPGIVELKRIPNSATLVVGHNGFGEFSLWDISKRILVSRFSSSPSTSVFQFLPISLVRWQREGPVPTDPEGKEHMNEIMAATKMSFLKKGENHAFSPIQGEDVAIWLLISTVSDSDVQHDYQSSDCKINPVGWWRLALLVKDMVILGSALDPRAAAIGASAGRGIIGTCDGLVYMWELSTGTKLGNLHNFKGAGVSCIATDDSRSGPLAVACGGQLLVYLDSQRGFFKSTGK